MRKKNLFQKIMCLLLTSIMLVSMMPTSAIISLERESVNNETTEQTQEKTELETFIIIS